MTVPEGTPQPPPAAAPQGTPPPAPQAAPPVNVYTPDAALNQRFSAAMDALAQAPERIVQAVREAIPPQAPPPVVQPQQPPAQQHNQPPAQQAQQPATPAAPPQGSPPAQQLPPGMSETRGKALGWFFGRGGA